MIQIPEIDIEIDDIDMLESCLCEELDQYLLELWDQPDMHRKPDEDDYVESEDDELWTDKAQKLIDEKFRQLYEIANKYDPGNEYDITSYMYKEL